MIRFFIQAIVTMAGLWLSAQVVPGVDFNSTGSLIAAALILGVVNAVVRPILTVLTFPITVITLGLFLLVVNAAMIGLTAVFLDGFAVNGLCAGTGAPIVTGGASWMAGPFIGGDEKRA